MVLMLSLVSRISVYEDSTSDFLIDVLRFAIVLLHELDLGSVDRREGCVRRGRGRGGVREWEAEGRRRWVWKRGYIMVYIMRVWVIRARE